jgi:4'-phosphopantetheinyl transferase
VSVYWLEQAQSDVPDDDEWLSGHELVRLGKLRIPKRRADWRLGRWTAKCAVAAVLQLPDDDLSPRHIEILADSSGAPSAYVGGQSDAVSISLSHRDGIAACSVTEANMPIGCDLEVIETRSKAFVEDYFTQEEQSVIARYVAGERDELVTTLWSAKESALKALRFGLRLDTRSVAISLNEDWPDWAGESRCLGSAAAVPLFSPGEWLPFEACFQNEQALYGWRKSSGNLVKTLVTIQPTKFPVLLNPRSQASHRTSASR